MYEIKIGKVLKQMLKEKRLTLKGISKETGIPYSTLHTWQENRQPKDVLKAQKLARYLGISLHELLFDQPDLKEQKNTESIQGLKEEFFKGTFEITVRKID
jgi:transcriptional regulator with XRE-family HTH domain